jgi:hypothetical protein
VLLLLAADANATLNRTDQVRAAIGAAAASMRLKVVAIPDDGILVGPTGKVRKFLMRERLLASTGAS